MSSLADLGHPDHQGAVDDVQRRHALGELAVEVAGEPVAGAVDDVAGQAFIEGQIVGWLRTVALDPAKTLGEPGDVALVDLGALRGSLPSPIARNRCQAQPF